MANVVFFTETETRFSYDGKDYAVGAVEYCPEADVLAAVFSMRAIVSSFTLFSSLQEFKDSPFWTGNEAGGLDLPDLFVINGEKVCVQEILNGLRGREVSRRRYKNSPIVVLSEKETRDDFLGFLVQNVHFVHAAPTNAWRLDGPINLWPAEVRAFKKAALFALSTAAKLPRPADKEEIEEQTAETLVPAQWSGSAKDGGKFCPEGPLTKFLNRRPPSYGAQL